MKDEDVMLLGGGALALYLLTQKKGAQNAPPPAIPPNPGGILRAPQTVATPTAGPAQNGVNQVAGTISGIAGAASTVVTDVSNIFNAVKGWFS